MEKISRVSGEIYKSYKSYIKFLFIVIIGIAVVLYWRSYSTKALSTIRTLKPIKDVSIKATFRASSIISTDETLKDPTVRKIVPYTVGGLNIRWVEWENKCMLPTNITRQYTSFSRLVCPGSNAIDVGAHSGDTAVGIATATHGGTTYAYEPHPKTFHILQLQEKLNPHIHLKTFNIALMKDEQNEMWWKGVGDGCNGGIQRTSCGKESRNCMKINSENVVKHFNSLPREFVEKLSFIKIDTEGNDRFLLRGLKDSILKTVRPLILIEWYTTFKNCNANAKDMFHSIEEIGYIPYGSKGQINLDESKPATCDNYFRDLILLPKEWDAKNKGMRVCPSQ